MLQHGSLTDALGGGVLKIYSGSQPASADAAITGSLIAIITEGSGTHTAEVLPQGILTLSGTTSGSLDTLTVGGISIISQVHTYDTSFTVTAANIAADINATSTSPDYTATSSGAVVTITGLRGVGATANALAIAETATTLTAVADATLGTTTAGVTAVNGLNFGTAAAGVLSKLSTQTWSGVASATLTAGYYRFYGSVVDAGGLDSAEAEIRLDGSIATSGGELNMSSTSITSGATQTVSSFAITLPTS